MKKLLLCVIALFLILLCFASASCAYVVTFDDVSPGQNLSSYYTAYGLDMAHGWEVVDTGTAGWGVAQSGNQALIWNGIPSFAAWFGFGDDGPNQQGVRSVGAYFTTRPGVILKMLGHTTFGDVTTSIGSAEGWTNHYVQLNAKNWGHGIWSNILDVVISPTNSPDAVYAFSMDDLTVTPVPEPSSLLALFAGLGGCGILLRRRRRRV